MTERSGPQSLSLVLASHILPALHLRLMVLGFHLGAYMYFVCSMVGNFVLRWLASGIVKMSFDHITNMITKLFLCGSPHHVNTSMEFRLSKTTSHLSLGCFPEHIYS